VSPVYDADGADPPVPDGFVSAFVTLVEGVLSFLEGAEDFSADFSDDFAADVSPDFWDDLSPLFEVREDFASARASLR
jgi:hypothetical protein